MIFGTAFEATPMTTDPQTVRIFLASSAELKPDREAFERAIARRNDDWNPRGVYLLVDKWEKLSAAMSPTRSQDEYNREIDRCDIFVVLFWTKVGRYTAEEFERAYARFKGGDDSARAPKIFTYFKTTPARASREDTQSLWAFQDRLAELKHFQAEYDTADKLNLEFGRELDRLVSAGAIRLDGAAQATDADPLHREHHAIRASYLDWLRHECDSVELLGLDLKESRNVGLGHVYVPAVTNAYVKGDRTGINLKKSPFLLLDNLGRRPLYVPGAAGSGKSTFCRWLALIVAEGQVPAHRRIAVDDTRFTETLPDTLVGRLPLLVRLRDWASHSEFLAGNGRWTCEQLVASLAGWLDKTRPGKRDDVQPSGLSGAVFRAELRAGRCLLILDGVDEVPESRGDDLPRRNLLSGLADALPAWRKAGNWLLLTSRPYGLEAEDQRRLGLPLAELAELPETLQQLFVRRWFDAVDPPNALAKADGLLAHLDQRDDLAEMRSNPMLLTALCVKYDEGRRLPQDFYDLYDAVLRQVLYKRFATENERHQARNRLAAIALGMHRGAAQTPRETPVAEVTVEEVDRLLADFAQQAWASESGAGDACAKRELLLSDSGLLLPRDNRRAAFYHLSFQEFLAAERLQRLDKAPEALEAILGTHAGTPAWRRTLRFLFCAVAERESAERAITAWRSLLPFFEPAALDANPAPALVLADCLEVAHAKGWRIDDFQGPLRSACDRALDHLPPETRAHLWLTLGRLGLDDRPGVGLRDGLPDIAWEACDAGEFLYGDAREKRRLKTPFHIARYPVTHRQFQAFVDAGGYGQDKWWAGLAARPEAEPARWSEPNAPRETVSWYEATAFCRWLDAQLRDAGLLPADWEVSLPTEEQWERAACGTDGREYPWEGDLRSGLANFNETWGDVGPCNLGRTSPVGLYPDGKAPSGVLDMAGNVWEWCRNEYDEPERLADRGDRSRVVRGGSWIGITNDCRAAFRDRSTPVNRSFNLGFRVCCAPPIGSHP
jgi:formylglycine-generating enzyme required for sulfatase activity